MSRFCFFICIVQFCASQLQIEIPNQGTIMGREVSKRRIQKINGYFGIPYAQPPLESLRFAPPRTDPLPAWDGVRNATEYYPACLQTEIDLKQSEIPFFRLLSDAKEEVNEDCLYLNVFTPQGTPPKNGFATIVWFHPGNFTTGSPAMWNPHAIVYRQRVIVVTVAYRLNIMGFFTTMDGEATGNYGLLDQQASMMWVKNNIAKFGGNPDNICLMGYGTGATSIGMHMINAESRQLFHKAIAMSGDFLGKNVVKYPEEDKSLVDRIAPIFACDRKPTSKLIDCLRGAEALLLVEQTSNVDWRPLIDAGLSNATNPFLSEHPMEFFDRGDFHKIPFLTGYTNMEQILEINLDSKDIADNITKESLQQIFTELISNEIPQMNDTDNPCMYNYDHLVDAIMFVYGPSVPIRTVQEFKGIIAEFVTDKSYGSAAFLQASYMSKHQPTYMYRFDMKPSTEAARKALPDWVSVPHLYDLLYVWGVPYWNTDHDWDLRDKRISDTIMSFWTNFARSSDPTENSIYPIKWEALTKENPGILIIDSTFNMSNGENLNYKGFEFWNDYYPKVFKLATQCCSVSDSGSQINFDNILLAVIFSLQILFKY
ncbi:unnamed protein product [Brassicogethes aeneus]|uniref:Carboxylesterase type B domain-containing protein n=1 Tax=Brassicogethes aeneus TaxID=1431903 RepID=A0A9P0BI11_BRAAE|nr:unnamed protein product [Brassicogethes aeneus]